MYNCDVTCKNNDGITTVDRIEPLPANPLGKKKKLTMVGHKSTVVQVLPPGACLRGIATGLMCMCVCARCARPCVDI